MRQEPSRLCDLASALRPDAFDRTRLPDAGPSSSVWVAALHVAACQRWLSFDPPGFDEAEATLERLKVIAEQFGALTGKPGVRVHDDRSPRDADPASRLREHRERLATIEDMLVKAFAPAHS